MALSYKNDEQSDERLDPYNNLRRAEQQTGENTGGHDSMPGYNRSADGLDDHPVSAGIANAKEQEDNPSAPRSEYGYDPSSPHEERIRARLTRIGKKNGPMAFILGLLISGGFGMTFLLSPSLLLIHIKETLVQNFNSQETVMVHRERSLLTRKLLGSNSGATKGVCGTVTIRCKYNSMSNYLLDKLDGNGIIAMDKSGKPLDSSSVFGNKPDHFVFTDSSGKKLKVPASDFVSVMDKNPEFAEAFTKSFNIRFAGFSDSIFLNALGKAGTSKGDPLKDGTKDDMEKQLVEETNGVEKPSVAGEPVPQNDQDPNASSTTANDQAASGASQTADELTQNSTKATASSVKNVVDDLSKKIDSGPVGLVAGLYCSAGSVAKELSTATRVVQIAQLARYAMTFLVVADMIKAGTASPTQVSFLATTLTTVLRNSSGKTVKQSATDGAGLKYGLFGDLPSSHKYQKGDTGDYTAFVPGGGWAAKLNSFQSALKLNSAPAEKVCGVVNSTAGQLFLGLGGGIASVLTTIGVTLAGPEISNLLTPLVARLVNSLAGTMVDATTVGEDAGDALTSGTLNLLSNSSMAGGGGMMSVSDATAFNQLSQQVAMTDAKYDRATDSPFDATNPNTYAGALYTQFLPYLSSFSQFSTAIFAPLQIANGAISSLTGGSIYASDQSQNSSAALSSCDDPNLKDIAAGPFCNIIAGIPPQYLDMDPDTVLTDLQGQYDESTGDPTPGSDLSNWHDKCTSGTGQIDGFCKIDSQYKAELALFYADKRVQPDMDGEDTVDNGTPQAATFTVGSFNLCQEMNHPASKKSACPMVNNQSQIDTKRQKEAATIMGTSGVGNPQFDIVGAQETSIPTQAAILSQDSGYESFPSKAHPFKDDKLNLDSVPPSNGKAIFWNTQKFNYVSGGFIYNVCGNGNNRTPADDSFPWVQLQSTGGQTVYVMSAHLPNDGFGCSDGPVASRAKDAAQILAWVQSKATGSNLVIVTGDFNKSGKVDDGHTSGYCTLTSDGTLQHAFDMAAKKDPSVACPTSSNNDIPIDQIYASTNVTGLTASGWKRIDDNGAKSGSDHSPAWVTLSTGTSQDDSGTPDAASKGATLGPEGFPGGQCVAYVKWILSKHSSKYHGGSLGNGNQVTQTLHDTYGYALDHTPAVYSTVSFKAPNGTSSVAYGHTAIVTAVYADGSIDVDESNFTQKNTYDHRHVSAAVAQASTTTYAHTEVGWH